MKQDVFTIPPHVLGACTTCKQQLRAGRSMKEHGFKSKARRFTARHKNCKRPEV